MEEFYKNEPNKAQRGEDAKADFEYLRNLYGKKNILTKSGDEVINMNPEVEKLAKIADLIEHNSFFEKRNQKDIDTENKITEIKRFQNEINTREESIKELQNRINNGGILPVEKESLLRQLEGLEKIQGITKRNASLAYDELVIIKNKSYEKPKVPGENISKN